MKNILFAVAVLLVVSTGLYVLFHDEQLRPEVQEMVARAEPVEASRAYTYLLGLHSPAGTDPAVSGQQLLHRIRQHEEAYLSAPAALDGNSVSVSFEHELTKPDGPLFCHFSQPECLPSLLQQPELINQVIQQHQELLQRWQAFLRMEDFRILTRPSLAEPFPPYQYLFGANRLALLHSLDVASGGDPAEGMAQMMKNLVHLRRLLAQDSHLVGKMVTVQLLSDQLDAINALSIRYDLPVDTIEPLSRQEKSLQNAIDREVAGMTRLLLQMNGRPDLLSETSRMPSWATHFLFKPGITANALYPSYRDYVISSELSPGAFTVHLSQVPIPKPKPHWIRNPVGTILNNIAMPNMREYAGRMHDLDVKFRLFNAIHQTSGLTAGDAANQFTNPYFPDDVKSERAISNAAICIKGPLADKQGLRCLRGFM